MYNKDGVISQDYYEHGMKLYTYKHVCVPHTCYLPLLLKLNNMGSIQQI